MGPALYVQTRYSEAEINFTGQGSDVHRITGWIGLHLGYTGMEDPLLFTLLLCYISNHPIATPVVWKVSSKIIMDLNVITAPVLLKLDKKFHFQWGENTKSILHQRSSSHLLLWDSRAIWIFFWQVAVKKPHSYECL